MKNIVKWKVDMEKNMVNILIWNVDMEKSMKNILIGKVLRGLRLKWIFACMYYQTSKTIKVYTLFTHQIIWFFGGQV
jgi:hypothetical protein